MPAGLSRRASSLQPNASLSKNTLTWILVDVKLPDSQSALWFKDHRREANGLFFSAPFAVHEIGEDRQGDSDEHNAVNIHGQRSKGNLYLVLACPADFAMSRGTRGSAERERRLADGNPETEANNARTQKDLSYKGVRASTNALGEKGLY